MRLSNRNANLRSGRAVVRGLHGITLYLCVLTLPMLWSCSSGDVSPEAQIRAEIQRAERAVEEKNGRGLRQQISEQYRDARGHDKQAIEGVIRYQLLRHDAIHLLTRVKEIGFPEPGRARAVVMVAMAGQPVTDSQALSRIKADLHRFEIDFMYDGGEWRVVSADWRRAQLNEFF